MDTTVRQLKTIIDPQKPATDYANANFPVDQEGRTLHLGCKASAMLQAHAGSSSSSSKTAAAAVGMAAYMQ